MSELEKTYPGHVATLRQRHDEALAASGLEGIAIHSGFERYRFLDDNPHPFVANPHFVSWLPLTDVPQSWILYRSGERPRLIYFQPEDYWHLPPSDPEGFWTQSFDITVIRALEELAEQLPAQLKHWAYIGEETTRAEALGFGAVNPDVLLDALHYQRAYKTDYEIACMSEASLLGARAHAAAARAFGEGASELEIHQAYLAAIDATENQLPYTNIIALNEHGAILHYHGRDKRAPSTVRSFLIDAGARFHGYASDITRSYAAVDDDFAALIRAMDARQRQLVDACRDGVDFRDLHLQTHRHIAELLLESELAAGSADELLEKDVTRAFLPHGLGHLIGVQVHDVGGFQAGPQGGTIAKPDKHPFLRLTRKLEPRMVTTIEPGLYFINSLLGELREAPGGKCVNWARVDQFHPYGGIRIEDDVLVTDGQPRNLTREAFAD